MQQSDILVLRGNEIVSLLYNQEYTIIQYVREAYIAHREGASCLPYSTFLHFPQDSQSRIIALPAYLGRDFEVAGVKWISSFPRNVEHGQDRASAVIVLNSSLTGMPEAILEGSIISAKRTAASAALAALYLQQEHRPTCVGIIGCGLINFEILRFLLKLYPEIATLVLFDTQLARMQQFKKKCLELRSTLGILPVDESNEVLRSCSLISIATTATAPHIFDVSICPPETVLLHISLRDLSPEVILECDNIVDDVEHVCRAQTSIHLAEQLIGTREHIRCTLADVLTQQATARKDVDMPVVFSPFGLGILDIAISKLVCDLARKEQQGIIIPSFFPTSWQLRVESYDELKQAQEYL